MIGRAADVAHALLVQPPGQFLGDVAGTVVGQQPGFVLTWILSQPDAVNASSNVSVTSSAFIVVHSFQAMT